MTLPAVLAQRHGGQPAQWQAWLRQHALPAHLGEGQLSPSQRGQLQAALLRHRPNFAASPAGQGAAPQSQIRSGAKDLADWARQCVLRWIDAHCPWALADSSDRAESWRRDFTERWLASGDDRPPQPVPWPSADAELEQLRRDPAMIGLPDASLRLWVLLLMLTRHQPLLQVVQRLAPSGVARAVPLGAAAAMACPEMAGAPPLVPGRVEQLDDFRGQGRGVLVRAVLGGAQFGPGRVASEAPPAAQAAGLLQRVQPLPAQRIPLVLSEATQLSLRDLTLRWQYRSVVREAGGSGGVLALLAGAPGHGRRTAARQIAEQLGLELFKVQAALLSSRWIGETEGRISQMFRSAAERGAALLVEDAQDLVTKHVELHSANDRYANTVRNHLLQEIESFQGLVLMIAAGPHQFDSAMQRRIHITARFDTPDRRQREAILESAWQWLMARSPGLMPEHPPEMPLLSGFEATPQQLVQAVLEAGMQASFSGRAVDEAALQSALVRQLRRSASVAQENT